MNDSWYPAAAVYYDGGSVLWGGRPEFSSLPIMYQLCDLELATHPLCISSSSPIKWVVVRINNTMNVEVSVVLIYPCKKKSTILSSWLMTFVIILNSLTVSS